MLWKLTLLQFKFQIRLQSFKQKIKNKTHLRKRSLVDQEWHLALEVLTSEIAHTEREGESHLQNNIKVKPEQLKLNKTDLSTWP
jgi:hypothetical protein